MSDSVCRHRAFTSATVPHTPQQHRRRGSTQQPVHCQYSEPRDVCFRAEQFPRGPRDLWTQRVAHATGTSGHASVTTTAAAAAPVLVVISPVIVVRCGV
jgi:hypothetical protein